MTLSIIGNLSTVFYTTLMFNDTEGMYNVGTSRINFKIYYTKKYKCLPSYSNELRMINDP